MTTQQAVINVVDAAIDYCELDWENIDPSGPLEVLENAVKALRVASRREEFLAEEVKRGSPDSKMCSKCQRTFHKEDFPITTCKGRLLVRSWCSQCLAAYYRRRNAETKERRAAYYRERREAQQ